ncbi:hypothetical protein L211DRAFT_689297 [Terfezia boudieri ATCC MYA-4762]|uniref:G-patch domain-containing protein n=1 Tax=Terfezia boudieri ATCC MYA-4762 TaxID=1051890 RepID=A0A3N4L881_9PEZI|nr:hypothetical protein L211DRAFT_689297 [Terfezia boudieri ATCC MYA-4762]
MRTSSSPPRLAPRHPFNAPRSFLTRPPETPKMEALLPMLKRSSMLVANYCCPLLLFLNTIQIAHEFLPLWSPRCEGYSGACLGYTAALRFQPTKRPQVNQTKSKPKISMKPVGPAAVAANTITETATATATATATIEPARPVVKTSLNDWAHTGNSDDDVNGFYASKEKERDRRRKKRRKNKEAEFEPVDWDDIYDPARPSNYEEYRDGDEKIREMDEWRDRLYGKKYGRDRARSDEGDSEDDYRPTMNRQFAPPSFKFAPPPLSGPPVEVPDDATGEDAYARRVRLSQMGIQHHPPPQSDTPPPRGPPSISPTATPSSETASASTISRAPILYQLPPTQPSLTPPVEAEDEMSERSAHPEDELRSLRPGQQGFAHRLLAKYGWTKGTGLGAEGSGIVKPLHVVASKKKDEAGRGKIIDQNKKHRDGDEGKFGKMTEVVVLKGMLRGIDKEEIASGELRQEIGEECGEKYGRVERVYIHVMGVDEEDGEGPKVFVQFTSQLSALRAVNALEGRLFNGNAIEAKFFDKDKFERGQYQ